MKISFSQDFLKQLLSLDNSTKKQVEKLLLKLAKRPELGKPMKHVRQGTREVYVGSLRLAYILREEEIYFVELYHKDNQ